VQVADQRPLAQKPTSANVGIRAGNGSNHEKMPESFWRDLEVRARVVATFLRIVIEAIVLDHICNKQ
jgi:hypothetical protein